KIVFREDFLKYADNKRGINYMPDFRSVDEVEKSIEDLHSSYSEFRIDNEVFTALEENDIIEWIANEAYQEIRKGVKGRTFGDVFNKVKKQITITEDDKYIWDKAFKLASDRLVSLYKVDISGSGLVDISS